MSKLPEYTRAPGINFSRSYRREGREGGGGVIVVNIFIDEYRGLYTWMFGVHISHAYQQSIEVI